MRIYVLNIYYDTSADIKKIYLIRKNVFSNIELYSDVSYNYHMNI